MAFTFGLLAALLWGLSDFLISIIGRSFGVLRAMFYAQCVGVVLVGGWILVAGLGVPQAPSSSWTAAIIAAPIGVAATLGLYQGLKVGQVSIVAPIAASFGAVTAVLSMFSGERLQASIQDDRRSLGCILRHRLRSAVLDPGTVRRAKPR
jgi:uncharacterized membrane protein